MSCETAKMVTESGQFNASRSSGKLSNGLDLLQVLPPLFRLAVYQCVLMISVLQTHWWKELGDNNSFAPRRFACAGGLHPPSGYPSPVPGGGRFIVSS